MAELQDLSDNQQTALVTYASVTNQEPAEAIPLLQRSEWNVQIAIAKFFDGEGPDHLAEARASLQNPPPQARHTNTLIDGLIPISPPVVPHGREPAPRVVPPSNEQGMWRPPLLIALLLSPFNLVTRLVGGVFSVVGYLLSLIPRLISGGAVRRPGAGPSSTRKSLTSADTAARFAREFEEEYGPHELAFFARGYAAAYDLAKKDLRFLLVILLSPEHDDNQDFVRGTLLAPEVVGYLNDPSNGFILWVGNVQDSEAYQVSTALKCSKFPFAALVAQTPQDSTTAMSTIAKLTGPQSPNSFLAKLRAAIAHQAPVLERARNARNEQQASRNLREEQNTAYERSLAQDRERARQRREAEASQRSAETEARSKLEAAERKIRNVEQWRRWRARTILPEPAPNDKDVSRVSVRTVSGDRIVRKFSGQADIEELYAFVDCQEVLDSLDSSSPAQEPTDYQHQYSFRLVSPMPRVLYHIRDGGSLGDRIGRSGNLIVEPIDDDELDI